MSLGSIERFHTPRPARNESHAEERIFAHGRDQRAGRGRVGTRVERRGGVRWRVAILAAAASARAGLGSAIVEAGGQVTVAAAPRFDAAHRVRRAAPDALLLAPGAIGDAEWSHLATIVPMVECATVLCLDDMRGGMVAGLDRAGFMALLAMPVGADQLGPVLDIAVARFRETYLLRRALAERKWIERAKGQIMARHGGTEEDAFRWLRQRAMDSRARLADVARAIVGDQESTMTSVGLEPRA